MKFIADLHIHSKYSRATSSQADLEHYAQSAKDKGILVVGTGDFTHPQWLQEIKEKLEPAEPGLFKLKNSDNPTRFLLTSEVSCIYSKKGRVRKIHLLILAPSLDVVEKINTQLSWIGNVKSDGRPILGLDAKELLKIVLNTSEDALVIPAHCLLPDTYLHTSKGIKKIREISANEEVYTHLGKLKKVLKIYTRSYKGPIYHIKPYNFRIGVKTTPEHPFYAIKAHTNCKNTPRAICKPACAYYHKRGCSHPYFKKYKPQWIQAKDLKKGDILIFPRFNNITKDVQEIKLLDYLPKDKFKRSKSQISFVRGRPDKKLPEKIKIDKNFCRLIGYYLSEGYTDKRDSISFCFNEKEGEYIKDVQCLMKKVFGLSSPRIYKRKKSKSVELIYFSKILAKLFGKLFYNHPEIKRAHTKCLPQWMLELPLDKQVEVLRGWWRGDHGNTSSRELMNQMKIICLRLGIIPSISVHLKDNFNEKTHRYKLENRIIKANYDLFWFYNLSFFEDRFGLLKTREFKKFNTKLARRHGWIDENNIYLPIRDIEITYFQGKVYNLEVEKDNSYLSEFAAVHNCWTPWFGIFGSKSGFDSIEECFEEYSKYIYAGETGLSSDPPMNWRVSALDRITLVSNSDAHSPQKLGREANVFNTELSYFAIKEAIKNKDKEKFLYTIEFYPEEGKYHFDGHRNCQIRLSPREAKKYNNTCPVCGRPLTLGVLHRVEDLADREENFVPNDAIPYKSLIPLEEIIAQAIGQTPGTKEVLKEYQKLTQKFGSEFDVLLNVSESDLKDATLPEIAEGIVRTRNGEVFIEPGFDGVFGKVRIFEKGEVKRYSAQKTLF
ncbi:MAG: hypothetical protein LR000_01940 [Candidatus Pacebacteria bacterium]|nr:hypothetical protein [Candidatus Paceibacterota bacterium]